MASTTYSYDGLGWLSSTAQIVNTNPIFATDFTQDNFGRLTQIAETVLGAVVTYNYDYDADGQLTEVRRNNITVEQYEYDVNGNRTDSPAGAATYNARDELLTQGGVAYQHDADGFLMQRGTDLFTYTRSGHLLGAVVNGTGVSYGYDPLGRRITRTEGENTNTYLYGDPLNLSVLTHSVANDGVITTYYYDNFINLIAMQVGADWYYVATDHLGSPRVVTDAAGTAIKLLEYNSYGEILSDSNPGFDLPIGFAGGLTDPVTGLVHFGFRDYDPETGRFLALDPLLICPTYPSW